MFRCSNVFILRIFFIVVVVVTNTNAYWCTSGVCISESRQTLLDVNIWLKEYKRVRSFPRRCQGAKIYDKYTTILNNVIFHSFLLNNSLILILSFIGFNHNPFIAEYYSPGNVLFIVADTYEFSKSTIIIYDVKHMFIDHIFMYVYLFIIRSSQKSRLTNVP